MNALDFASAHPWWTLVYLLLGTSFILALVRIAASWRPVEVHHHNDRTDTHNHNHNWPHGTTAKVHGNQFTVQLPTHPPGCCRHPRRECAEKEE